MALQLTDSQLDAAARALRENDEDCLAPLFRQRLDAAIAEANNDDNRLDVASFETCRSDALARLYFANSRSRAPTAAWTWHGYGLGDDIVRMVAGQPSWDYYPDGSKYAANPEWWENVYRVFKSHNLDAGGDWHSFHDWPHWQLGGLPSTPTQAQRDLLASSGKEAVWQLVGADMLEAA